MIQILLEVTMVNDEDEDGLRMVASGSGGQEMEQLELINQPLIY